MESYRELIEETQVRVSRALEALLDGTGPDEAVLRSGMLKLFDDGDHIDGMAQIEELSNTAPEEWERIRVLAVFEALRDMLASCAEWEPHHGGEQITARLVIQYHNLAPLVPIAVWRYRLDSALSRLNERSVATEQLAVARARAVERLGSLKRLMSAVEQWQPDAEERTRLQRLLTEGREVDAVVQALEQAVFSAELEDL